jgi:SAM-dependent methyltransferase
MSQNIPGKSAAATAAQQAAFEKHFEGHHRRSLVENTGGNQAPDPIGRFLLERRLRISVLRLMQLTDSKPADWSALVICAGNGIEGTVLANTGFREVTISDFSETGLGWGMSMDARLKGCLLDAENMDLPDNSYDLVLVQDVLHHLPRPPIGLTEMLRVARRAVIVIEPHDGIVGRLLGTRWERVGATVNYVFRWNKWLFDSVVRSYLLLGSKTAEVVAAAPVDPRKPYALIEDGKEHYSYRIDVTQLWDHHAAMQKLAGILGNGRLAFAGVRAAYGFCACFLPGLGNMFIGIVVKDS